MPHLLNFLKGNGTLLTNDHTILISHTAGGILSSLTGLYPDRHGQTVSNSYDYFQANGVADLHVVVQVLDRHRSPAANDPLPNMVGDGGADGARAVADRTRDAGCNVGGVSTANIVLENNNAIVPVLLVAASAGAANIKVASVSRSSRPDDHGRERAGDDCDGRHRRRAGTGSRSPRARERPRVGSEGLRHRPGGDMTPRLRRRLVRGTRPAPRSSRKRHRRAHARADRLRRHRDPLRQGRRSLQQLDARPDAATICRARTTASRGCSARSTSTRRSPAGTAASRRPTARTSPTSSASAGSPASTGRSRRTRSARSRDAGERRAGDVRLHLRRARQPHADSRVGPGRGRLPAAAEGLRRRRSRRSSHDSPHTGSTRATRSSSSPSTRATTSPAASARPIRRTRERSPTRTRSARSRR